MDSSQSSSDDRHGIDSVKRCPPSCDRGPASEELGGPTPPMGYERDVRVRTPASSSGAPAAPGTSRALHFVKWTLAMVGVFALYLLLQLVVAMVGGVLLASIGYAVSGGADAAAEGAVFDNGIQVVMAVSQLLAIAVFWPWWRNMRAGSFAERRGGAAPRGASVARSVALLLVIGIAAQFFVGVLLTVVELFLPETMAEYAELMEESGVGVFALVAMVSTAVLAPINEEIVCRGVMLEYALRAVSPRWDARDRARRLAVSKRAFWVANALQALAFGVLHLNIIQGSYAFAIGALEGWVFWRTGKLRYPMMLHLAVNASSYLIDPLAPLLDMVPLAVVFTVSGALLFAGVRGFASAWPGADCLPALPDPTEPPALEDEAPSPL